MRTLVVATAIASFGFAHRDGPEVIGNDGAPLVMKGVNLGGWLLWEGWIMGGQLGLDQTRNSETTIYARLVELLGADGAATFRERFRDTYITEADIARIAELGFNSVRVPFNHRLLDDASGFKRLDDVIAWGTRHHVYIVLDMHAAPGGQCNAFVADPDPVLVWDDAAAQARTVELWRTIAARYKDRAWVAGYDLLNEPCKGTSDQLRALYIDIIAAIRQVDRNHMVIVEGNSAATDFTGLTSLLDPNQAYSFHNYNFLGDYRAWKFPGYARMARAQNAPLWAGEFGEANLDYIQSSVAMFDDPAYAVTAGYSLWTWKRAASGKPTVESVSVPALWTKTMRWITTPFVSQKPTKAEAALGAAQYLASIALDHCDENDELAAVLTGP